MPGRRTSCKGLRKEGNVRFTLPNSIASHASRLPGLLVVLSLCVIPAVALERSRGQIICRDEISLLRRHDLAHKLQKITGWRELTFDQQGRLSIGRNTVESGSVSARSLIDAALVGNKVLIIEDASNRADVVFARVVPGRWKNNAQTNPEAFVLLIDFADFDRLMGDRPALEAFNVGWAVLHELDHVVNDSVDSEVLGHVGECEAHINKMRRECDLPERLEYLFSLFPDSERSEFHTRLVRLAFDQEDAAAKKHRRFWVIWDAAQVGGFGSSGQTALLH